MKLVFSVIGIEPIVWLGALLWLGLSEPQSNLSFSLCPLANLGLKFCPGCGLGRSISYALHGNFLQSIHLHLLGIPAILILAYRTVSLVIHAMSELFSRDRNSEPVTVPYIKPTGHLELTERGSDSPLGFECKERRRSR
jgi:hypothetical protein